MYNVTNKTDYFGTYAKNKTSTFGNSDKKFSDVLKNKNTEETQKANETGKNQDNIQISAADKPQLSEKAQSYLDKLKEKYGDSYDFIISDYSTDDEGDALLAKGKGEYNVLITPDLLEKMANDDEVATKYEDIITNASQKFDDMKSQLGDDTEAIQSYNIKVDGEGNVNYSVLLKESFKGLNGKDDKETNKVSASSIEELLAKIKEIAEKRTEQKADAEKTDETDAAEEIQDTIASLDIQA